MQEIDKDPDYEVDVFFALTEVPMFAMFILNKLNRTVQISLIITENDDVDPDPDDAEEMVYVQFEDVSDAIDYYDAARHPVNLNEIINRHLKLKEQ